VKQYQVNTYQTVIVPVLVEANSPDDAKELVRNGNGQELEPYDFELDENNDAGHWEVTEV
jgi:hypothetical protein